MASTTELSGGASVVTATTRPRRSWARLLGRAGVFGLTAAALRTSVANAAFTRSGVQAPLATERDKVAHLFRRAGFGYSPEDLDFYGTIGVQGTVDFLVNYAATLDDVDARLANITLNLNAAGDMQRWWLLRMIYTKRPLLEKMVLFWHGLLTSAFSKVGLPSPTPANPTPPNLLLNQNQFFRDHALDSFGVIMKGISRDPAMILWLDSNANVKGRPNENYARELMELFTLGIAGPDGTPNYTEQDVREVARAFTGWTINAQQQFVFNAAQHDTGPKTIFGHTGNFDGDDVIDLILQHPSCAYYVSKRLFEFFVYPNPSTTTLAPFVDTFRATGGSIKAVVQAILLSPELYSERAYRALVRAPAEFIPALARGLKLDTDAFNFQNSVTRMAQALFNPPSVAGWPGGVQWINTTAWLEHVNFANTVLGIRADPHTQPVDLLGFVQRYGLDTPEKAVDFFLGLLVDGQATPDQRLALVGYTKEGNLWPPPGQPLKATDPALDEKLRGAVYLILTMPEFLLA